MYIRKMYVCRCKLAHTGAAEEQLQQQQMWETHSKATSLANSINSRMWINTILVYFTKQAFHALYRVYHFEYGMEYKKNSNVNYNEITMG